MPGVFPCLGGHLQAQASQRWALELKVIRQVCVVMLPEARAAIGVLGAETEDLLNPWRKRAHQLERHDQRVGFFRRDDRSLHRDGQPATVMVGGHVGPAAMNDLVFFVQAVSSC